jgi:hypothetical protein
MTITYRQLVLLAGMLVTVAGCASSEEWQTWKNHPTHFASGDHLSFSARNREGAAPKVRRQDIALAREEGWWGKPVTVAQAEILER